MKRKKRKSPLTLIEIMIVIFIIGMISSVVGVNMRKSLEKGKHFKTKQAITKLYNIMEMAVADGTDLESSSAEESLEDTVTKIVRNSNFVRKSKDVLADGWGKTFKVEMDGDQVKFTSAAYENYCNKNSISFDYPWEDEQEE